MRTPKGLENAAFEWHTEPAPDGRLHIREVRATLGALSATVRRVPATLAGKPHRYRVTCCANGLEILVHHSHSRMKAFAHVRRWLYDE